MKLSTRNQLPGTVVSVAKGEAMAVVKVRLDGGDQILTSSITRDAADDLGDVSGLVARVAGVHPLGREGQEEVIADLVATGRKAW